MVDIRVILQRETRGYCGNNVKEVPVTVAPQHTRSSTLAELALRHAPVPSAILGPDGITSSSETFAAVLRAPWDSLVGLPTARLPLSVDDGSDIAAAIRRGGDHVVTVPGGRSMRLRVCALPTEGGYALLQLEDLTGRERELHGAVRRLRDLVDHSSAMMFMKSLDGRYLVANESYLRSNGYTAEEVLGRTDHELYPRERADEYVANDLRVLSTGEAIEVEEPTVELEPPDGETELGAWLSIKFPLLDDDGRPYALGAVSTDISDRKRAEAQVRQAADLAERANQAKSEFVSRMSHELRTPLNAIIGFGQLLRLEPLEPPAASSVDRVLDAAQHLLGLVNEVLDLSWIEAGAPGLALVATPAATPLQEALQLVRLLANERDIELISDLHGALNRYVLADPQRLKQIFLNLLSNAIKYNRPAGVIRVRCHCDGENLRFLFTDTGIGIAEQDVARLFAPFTRLNQPDGDTEGSGLGLALSRRLAEEMGGQLEVLHTAPGEGSTFFLELPLIPAPEEPPELSALPAFSPDVGSALAVEPGATGTVLYIEDTPANVELVARILDRMGGLKLLNAMRAHAGLQLAATHRPDLILLDLHLADLDGDEVVRRLKADEATAGIPLIVVSADATPARVRRMKELGINDYLTKPLDVLGFALAVRSALGTS